MTQRQWGIFPVLLLAAAVSPVQAQGIQVSIADTQFAVATDGVQFQVTFQNSGTRELNVKDVRVILPMDLAKGRPLQVIECSPSFFDLDPGSVRECDVAIPWVRPRHGWPYLFYRTRDQKLMIRANYSEQQQDGATARGVSGSVTDETTVAPVAPLPIVLAGAVAGVLFVVGFRLLRNHVNSPRLVPWAAAAREAAFGIFVSFGVVAALRVAAEPIEGLGIDLDVRDVIGGAVIGLAFEPLARLIDRYINRRQDAQPAPAKPGVAATSPAPSLD